MKRKPTGAYRRPQHTRSVAARFTWNDDDIEFVSEDAEEQPMTTCKPYPVAGVHGRRLEKIVQTYLEKNAADEDRYLRFYEIQRTLPEAITKAVLAVLPNGKRFSHQRRIPGRVLERAREALLKQNYEGLNTFSELHDLVARVLTPIRGIGALTIYDTAHRLGAHLNRSPEHVYMHAGARVGAKALGLSGSAGKLSKGAFPEAFQRLRPEQIEDCLCIYKADLQEWAREQCRPN